MKRWSSRFKVYANIAGVPQTKTTLSSIFLVEDCHANGKQANRRNVIPAAVKNLCPQSFSWPQEQCELSRHELKAREESCKAEYLSACADMRIDADLLPYLRGMYIPLAAWLERRQSEMGSPLVVGLTGGQGSGKSTTSELLKCRCFRHAFGKTTASLSIDDFYKNS